MQPLQIVQLVISILLVVAILLQQKGSGLGDAFGGTTDVYVTRRGAEKFLHVLTYVLGAVFAGLTILQLLQSV